MIQKSQGGILQIKRKFLFANFYTTKFKFVKKKILNVNQEGKLILTYESEICIFVYNYESVTNMLLLIVL